MELQLFYKDRTSGDVSATSVDFDLIILTAPFTSYSIEISPLPSLFKTEGTLLEYAVRHIMLFTTLKRVSPTYFNQSANVTLPENILTSPKPELGAAGILSITVVDIITPAGAGDYVDELEYVYKITSSRPIQIPRSRASLAAKLLTTRR
jgi:hypothetical protein